jgi:hypothetical protein
MSSFDLQRKLYLHCMSVYTNIIHKCPEHPDQVQLLDVH